MNKIRTAIFGGSGYGGSELLRILLFHPSAEISFVTANEHAGKLVGDVHQNLRGLTDLHFSSAPSDLSILNDIDVVFFALPHGQALELEEAVHERIDGRGYPDGLAGEAIPAGARAPQRAQRP